MDAEIKVGDTKTFSNTAFVTREKFGPELTRTNSFRVVGLSVDPALGKHEVRAEAVPNPCKPPSSGQTWFSRKEWLVGSKLFA